MNMHNPAHPGEVLREYIDGFSVTEVAQRLGVSRVALSRVLNGKSAISPEMALRLGQLLNNTPEFWLTIQANYDLWQVQQQAHFHVKPLFA